MKIRAANTLSPSRSIGWPIYCTIAVWLVAVAVSAFLVTKYQFTTSDVPAARAAKHWPTDSKLPREPNRSTLVLFLHPKCPCSQATLSELERLFTSIHGLSGDRPDFIVDATVPSEAGPDWLATDTMQRAREIGSARVFVDRDGSEASLFGAATSGFLMLFDQDGERQYAGGITESRGHEGESIGYDTLQKLLNHEIDAAAGIPTFGCRLCLPENKRASSIDRNVGAM